MKPYKKTPMHWLTDNAILLLYQFYFKLQSEAAENNSNPSYIYQCQIEVQIPYFN
jgi:hypothetical protein